MNVKSVLKLIMFFTVCGMLGVVCVQAELGNTFAVHELKDNFRYSWVMFSFYAIGLLVSLVWHSKKVKENDNAKDNR